jgi:sec-independent protein translocase protein TatC
MRAELGPARSADDESGHDFGLRTPLLARLDDLRRRIVRVALAVGLGFLLAFGFSSVLFNFVMVPLQRVLPGGGRLIYTQAPGGFLLYLKISAVAGVILASPVVLWQVWGLVAPVLSRRVRRQAVAFVVFSTLLFLAGAAFAHFIAFPWLWQYLVGFSTSYVRFLPEIGPAFSLYVRVVLALGFTFQMPVVVFFLARLGVITHHTLIRYGRYAVLAAFVVSAVITPPDFVSQVLMTGPLLLLYAVAIGIAWAFGPRVRREV